MIRELSVIALWWIDRGPLPHSQQDRSGHRVSSSRSSNKKGSDLDSAGLVVKETDEEASKVGLVLPANTQFKLCSLNLLVLL